MDDAIAQHPLSAAFPRMTDEAKANLRADIAANGLRMPITLYQGQVLDGWHRQCACLETGVEPRYEEFIGDEAAARKFVLSANLWRRQLTPSQVGIVAARFATLAHGGDRRTGKDQAANLPLATAEAAQQFNVSERTVRDGRVVLTSGDTEALARVERGDVSVSRAAKQIRAATPLAPRSANVALLNAGPIDLDQWHTMPAEVRPALLQHRNPKATLNRQKDGEDDNLIDWAMYSWNPITGCEHDCPYCYARDIAERFRGPAFPNGFAPTLHPDRLSAPFNQVPLESDDPRERRIFVGSMSDVFGRWVPREWIEAILGVAAEAKQWEFLMLTKFPKRMAEFPIPNNVWMGTTIDCQARVAAAVAGFEHVRARVKWISAEPLLEPLKIPHLDRFNLLVIGGASASSKTPLWIPPFEWVADVMRQADAAGCRVFLKSNLLRKEQPFGRAYRFTDQLPAALDYLKRATPAVEAA
jgi:protein gp37